MPHAGREWCAALRVGEAMRVERSRSSFYRTLALRCGEEPDPRLACPWCGLQAIGRREKVWLHPGAGASCIRCGRRVSTPALTMLAAFPAAGILVAAVLNGCDASSSGGVYDERLAIAIGVGLYFAVGYGAVLLIGTQRRLVRRPDSYGRGSVLRVASDAFDCDSAQSRRVKRARNAENGVFCG